MTGKLGAPGAEPGSERRIELDEATRRQLASLGYVSSVSPSESGISPDPRERHRERLLRTAQDLFDRGLEQEAAERCSRLLARHPDDRRIASGCERLRGKQHDEAERRRASGGAEPTSGADLAAILARAEANAAKRDAEALREALTLLTKALASGSGDARTPDAEMLRIASGLGRVGDACWAAYAYGEAAHAFMLAARLVPSDPRPAYNAGLAWERMGEMSEALRAYDRALALDPDLPNLRKHRDYAAAVLARIVGGPGDTE
jgi:tetratricopeptide (TPR) repeat protein